VIQKISKAVKLWRLHHRSRPWPCIVEGVLASKVLWPKWNPWTAGRGPEIGHRLSSHPFSEGLERKWSYKPRLGMSGVTGYGRLGSTPRIRFLSHQLVLSVLTQKETTEIPARTCSALSDFEARIVVCRDAFPGGPLLRCLQVSGTCLTLPDAISCAFCNHISHSDYRRI
jgi:hypothetical protein